MKRFDLQTVIQGVVAVGILILAYQVLEVVLQDAALRPQAMLLLLVLLEAVVYYFFPRKS